MRRPAQQHHTGPAAPGWVRPYTGLPGIAVFYNDGGQGDGGQPPSPAVPSPADVAARGQQAQPPAAPAIPAQQAGAGDDDQVLLDHRTNAPMTQATFAKIMARENAKGRRAALRELAESAGIPFTGLVSSDPDDAELARLAQVLKDAETTRQAQLSEEQRRTEELAAREQALQAREEAIAQRDAETAKQRRTSQLEAALVRLGAVDLEDKPNLQDAFAMLERDLSGTDNVDAAAIAEAADKLKARRPELFGSVPAQQTLPPAPSGGPAGGNAPRTPSGSKDTVKEEARRRAERMGLRSSDAA